MDSAGCPASLIERIRFFQHAVLGIPRPDARIEPDGLTFYGLVTRARLMRPLRTDLGAYPAPASGQATGDDALHGHVDAYLYAVLPELASRTVRYLRAMAVGEPASTTLTTADFVAAAASLGSGISPAMVHAFADVESGGRSGFTASGRPVAVYEGHVFRRLTKHRFDATYPALSYAYTKKAGPEWQAINGHGEAIFLRALATALRLDHDAALQACSWGMFQVLGTNYKLCGFPDVDAFVNSMKNSAQGQLEAFVGYCKGVHGLIQAPAAKNFAKVAAAYNGNDYGNYDTLIANAYKKHGGT